jgi:GNAT superfamily N-acetyltransferase
VQSPRFVRENVMHATNPELSRRIDVVAADYLLQRYSGPGNPIGTQVLRIGNLLATKVPFLKSNELMNSVHHLDDAALLPRVLAFYAETEQTCWVPVPPYFPIAVTDALQARGFRIERYASALVTVGIPQPHPHTEVREIDSNELDVFLDTLNVGFGQDPATLSDLRRNQSFWSQMRDWHLFLASVDGVAAGAAVLSIHGGAGYLAAGSVLPEYRGRGLQTALIAARLECARARRCRVVSGGADWGSQSQRNMQRAGLEIAHVRAIWSNRVIE